MIIIHEIEYQNYIGLFEISILSTISTKIDELKNFISKNILSQYNQQIKQIKQDLIKAKVDISKIKEIAKPHSLSIVKKLKDGKYKEAQNEFVYMWEEFLKHDFLIQLSTSIIMLIMVFFLNTFLASFFFILTGNPVLAHILTVVFVAPFTEEYFKHLSVKTKNTGMYFVVFNIAEFSLYITNYWNIVSNPISLIIARLLAVGLHLVNTLIHVRGKITKTQNDAFWSAVGLHFIWNALAVLGSLRHH